MPYTNKTQPTTVSPEKYLKENFKGNEKMQNEALVLIDVYSKTTGSPCVMWNKIFGFGKYYYQDSTGGEHAYIMTGFAVSKAGFTLYTMTGWEKYKKDIEKLGKYKITGKSCLTIKSVADIDLKVLKFVLQDSLVAMKKRYTTEK